MFVKTLASSQTIRQPNYTLKSHETLDISSIEVLPEKTLVYLTIENRIAGGNFCADKNIYLILPDGERLKLSKSSGIPVCPDVHNFKLPGEKLDFILTFPPLKQTTISIDLIEVCSENCFSFYGVILDNQLNKELDEAMSLAEKDDFKGAITAYIKILNSLPDNKKGIKGGLYTDIITLLVRTGDRAGAAEWYKKMVNSDAPRLDLYIANLNSRGIKF